ncbi:MAG: type II/IV secretion system protein [Pseudanabaena sp.]|nr:MAG: type II/IV secretion system protein [Pseudanabaena sp.]
MQAKSTAPNLSIVNSTPWQLLKTGKISHEEAIAKLVNSDGTVSIKLLDPEVYDLFFRQARNQTELPYLIPLLFWRKRFFIGAPEVISELDIKRIGNLMDMTVEVVSITKKSYQEWFLKQNICNDRISLSETDIPFADELAPMAIADTAEMYLSKADDQISRIKAIIASALKSRASDIHLEPTQKGLRIRFRVDGILQDAQILPLNISTMITSAIKVMADMDIAKKRIPQDGRIGEKYADDQMMKGLDMRVSTLPSVNGEKVVIRLLPQENPFSKIADLGFTPKSQQVYEKWIRQPQGMIIFTGPTGSGKTSTLYTSLQAISTEEINVTTVEDPVEYVLPNITQTQVNELAGMTFAAGLRAILRQDPDVILVGEIRDVETAETAVRAALTGHLVLTTMHTNDAPSAIPRIRDMGLDPSLVSDSLLGVVAQRLVRRNCPHCSAIYVPTTQELEEIGLSQDEIKNANFRKGNGCSKCSHKGYLGREAVIELLEVDDVMRQIIYEGSMTQLTQYLQTIDFQSFRKAAIAKVMSGVTTIAEVLRVLPRSALARKKKSLRSSG